MRRPEWLLIGGDSMLGKEIRNLVEEQKLPVVLRLASSLPAEHVLAQPAEDEEDLTVIEPLDAALVEAADVILLGGTIEAGRQALALAHQLARRPALIDLTGQFEDLPESRLRAPMIESLVTAHGADAIHTLAHPAAVALARVLTLVHLSHVLRRAVATVFEPASERGRAGIDELHQQTVNLFNFAELPQDVFDAQVAFNLLPRYGSEAPHALSESAARVERHLASLLGARAVPLPSTRLVQAPVFHSYCVSLWLEFESRPPASTLENTITSAGLDLRTGAVEAATNVSVAGQSGLSVGEIAEDSADGGGMWLWLAFDNIRAQAEAALLTAGMITRGRGGP